MNNCPKCQQPVNDGDMICGNCGSAIVANRPEGFSAAVGQMENRDIMAAARQSLQGRWGLAIGTYLVYAIIVVAVSYIPVMGSLASLIISGPMVLGLCIFFLSLSRQGDPALEQIFQGFEKFGVALGAYLLQAVFVFLWALLLIIPGIIAALSYSQTFYIIAEDDGIGPLEAIRKSKEMMRGHKWKIFCLAWRFIGWVLLCMLTLGIGYLWLFPYMEVSYARFYDDVSGGGIAQPAAATAEES